MLYRKGNVTMAASYSGQGAVGAVQGLNIDLLAAFLCNLSLQLSMRMAGFVFTNDLFYSP